MAAVKVESHLNLEYQENLKGIMKIMMMKTMMVSYSLMELDIGKVNEIVSSYHSLKEVMINYRMDNLKLIQMV